jgi:hypothetical protein
MKNWLMTDYLTAVDVLAIHTELMRGVGTPTLN